MKIGENQEEIRKKPQKKENPFLWIFFVENVIDRRIFEAYHR